METIIFVGAYFLIGYVWGHMNGWQKAWKEADEFYKD